MERELSDRLTKIEVLLENHLAHHEQWLKYLLAPILVIVIATCLISALNLIF